MFFFVVTKSLNCEILTKNFKNFNIWGFTEKFDFFEGGEIHGKPINRGNFLKRGLGSLQI